MSNESIRLNAVCKRDAALAEAHRWEDFIRMLDELEGHVQSVVPPSATRPAAVRLDQNGQPRMVVGTGKLNETERVALEAIREAGKPLSTRELLDALAARGIDVGGKDPASTLSARLSRAANLENVRPYGWRPKEPRQTGKAAETRSQEESAASVSETTNDAVMRGEVAHDNMT